MRHSGAPCCGLADEFNVSSELLSVGKVLTNYLPIVVDHHGLVLCQLSQSWCLKICVNWNIVDSIHKSLCKALA